MRLFTAIDLGDRVRTRARELLEELERRAGRLAPRARVTWVVPDRMHLTVRFIGEVTEAQGAEIRAALRDPLPIPPFDVSWEGLGAFPPRGAPRVLWVGVGRGADELVRLADQVSARLLTRGIPLEERPYSPHLTLARVREPAGLQAAGLFAGLDGALGTTAVETVTLFQSRLSPKGPAYTVLQQTALAATWKSS